MKFNKLLNAGIICAFLMGMPVATTLAKPSAQALKPNILFLFADDLGWGDPACYGHPYIKTPGLDRLANEGTRFNHFYVCGYVCNASRTAVMTGRYPPNAFGGSYPIPDGNNWGWNLNYNMAPGTKTLPQMLKRAGYRTMHAGKWHLNSDAYRGPEKYGIDVFQSYQRMEMGNFPADMEGARNGGDQKLARAVIAFMKQCRDSDTPFYAQLWFNVPHAPVIPSEEELAEYPDLDPSLEDFSYTNRKYFEGIEDFDQNMRGWCAQVTGHDKVVVEVLDALDMLGLTENTIVLYSSDNGPAKETNANAAGRNQVQPMGSSGPYRDRKKSYFEGGVTVPGLVRWPGKVPVGRIDDQTVWTTVDFMPTLCSLAGVEINDYAYDGMDVSAALFGDTLPCNREIVWGTDPKDMAIRDHDWKYYEQNGTAYLFDLSSDPQETTNLLIRNPEKADNLRNRLEHWRSRLVETLERTAKVVERL